MHEDRRELSTADLAARTKASDREPVERGESHADVPPTVVRPAMSSPPGPDDTHRELFGHGDAEPLRTQWGDIQAAFVDAPREAVQRADALVAQVMQRMAETFARERATLEQQWDRGDNVTTEDLRVALQRYRAFFDRLLSM